jgi:hypothetical protein
MLKLNVTFSFFIIFSQKQNKIFMITCRDSYQCLLIFNRWLISLSIHVKYMHQ